MTLTRFAGLLGWIVLSLTSNAAPLEWWVSPAGNDTHPGTRTQPLATLEAARDRLRQARQHSNTTANATIWIRGGVYPRRATLHLSAMDSGTSEHPVVYRGVPGERPQLVGGQPVQFDRCTDPVILARLDTAARNALRVADLPAHGLTHYGQLASRGFGRPLTSAHLELFHAGRPMTLARWPNEGEWTRIAGFPDTSAQPDDHGGRIGDLKAPFHYDTDRPRRWADRNETWVHGYWAWDWANSYERVETFDDDQRTLRTAPPHGLYGFRKGQRFYFLNILEELDQPGEYYLDRASGRLYFWPPPGTEAAESLVSVLESPLITLDGASHITVRNLELVASRGTALRIQGGTSNRLEACWLHNLGNSAVIVEGGQGHAVQACDIEDTGDGGVSLSGGDRRTLAPGEHRVENCHFQRQGRWSKCYVPAILMNGVGLTAAHNLIHDHPHCAILFTGNDHLLEFNDIHHIALETGDVGAIYTGRDWTYRGNRIRHNYLHETGGVGMGSMGVYMDDCISGTEIFGNVFYKVQRAAFLGGGRDHRVENNVFVECRPAVAIDGRGLDRSPVWHNMVYQFMKERLTDMPQDLYRSRYPALLSLDRYYEGDPGVPPENNLLRRNVSMGGTWLEVGWHAKPEMAHIEDNLTDQDPRFLNAAQQDFRLDPDSPAWKLGFQPIPIDRMGLRDDGSRRELQALRQTQPGPRHGQ